MRIPDLLAFATLWLVICSAVAVGQITATWWAARGGSAARTRRGDL